MDLTAPTYVGATDTACDRIVVGIKRPRSLDEQLNNPPPSSLSSSSSSSGSMSSSSSPPPSPKRACLDLGPLWGLPPELWVHVFGGVYPARRMIAASLVCRTWSQLWRAHIIVPARRKRCNTLIANACQTPEDGDSDDQKAAVKALCQGLGRAARLGQKTSVIDLLRVFTPVGAMRSNGAGTNGNSKRTKTKRKPSRALKRKRTSAPESSTLSTSDADPDRDPIFDVNSIVESAMMYFVTLADDSILADAITRFCPPKHHSNMRIRVVRELLLEGTPADVERWLWHMEDPELRCRQEPPLCYHHHHHLLKPSLNPVHRAPGSCITGKSFWNVHRIVGATFIVGSMAQWDYLTSLDVGIDLVETGAMALYHERVDLFKGVCQRAAGVTVYDPRPNSTIRLLWVRTAKFPHLWAIPMLPALELDMARCLLDITVAHTLIHEPVSANCQFGPVWEACLRRFAEAQCSEGGVHQPPSSGELENSSGSGLGITLFQRAKGALERVGDRIKNQMTFDRADAYRQLARLGCVDCLDRWWALLGPPIPSVDTSSRDPRIYEECRTQKSLLWFAKHGLRIRWHQIRSHQQRMFFQNMAEDPEILGAGVLGLDALLEMFLDETYTTLAYSVERMLAQGRGLVLDPASWEPMNCLTIFSMIDKEMGRRANERGCRMDLNVDFNSKPVSWDPYGERLEHDLKVAAMLKRWIRDCAPDHRCVGYCRRPCLWCAPTLALGLPAPAADDANQGQDRANDGGPTDSPPSPHREPAPVCACTQMKI